MEKLTPNQKQQKQLINNILDYYFSNSISKYDAINLVIATLNEKIDPLNGINENLEKIKQF